MTRSMKRGYPWPPMSANHHVWVRTWARRIPRTAANWRALERRMANAVSKWPANLRRWRRGVDLILDNWGITIEL